MQIASYCNEVVDLCLQRSAQCGWQLHHQRCLTELERFERIIDPGKQANPGHTRRL